MNEILKKIYLEQNFSTNLSLFVASLVTLLFYIVIEDKTIIFIFLIFVCLFSVTKVLIKLLTTYFKNKSVKSNTYNIFSETEKQIIEQYVKKGTCFIPISDYRERLISGDGLDSLVSRGYIEFVDNSLGTGPSGFLLKEDIYIYFIEKNKLSRKV